MPVVIQTRRELTDGNDEPQVNDLAYGELAVNTQSAKLWVGDAVGNPVLLQGPDLVGVREPDSPTWTGDHIFQGNVNFEGPSTSFNRPGALAQFTDGYIQKLDNRTYNVLIGNDVPNWAQIQDYVGDQIPPGGGEANDGDNLGTGAEVYAGKAGVSLEFRTLVAGTNVTIDQLSETLVVNANLPAGSGEANTSSNAGAGEGLALPKNGVDLPFKSLVAGSNITLTPAADSITIAATGGGGGVDPGDNVTWTGSHTFQLLTTFENCITLLNPASAGDSFNICGSTFGFGSTMEFTTQGPTPAGYRFNLTPTGGGSLSCNMGAQGDFSWNNNVLADLNGLVLDPYPLSDLGDVSYLGSPLTINDMLVWDGANWIPDQTLYAKIQADNVFTGAINTFNSVVGTTFNGNDFRSSDTVASPANALLRRDIIEALIAASIPDTSDFVTLNTVQTITAQKTFDQAILALGGVTSSGPVFINASNPPTAANEATRKDYVDAQIAAIPPPITDYVTLSTAQTIAGQKTFTPRILATGGLTAAATVLINAPQGAGANEATRKDYVDGQIATRAPTAHTHVTADITDLNLSGYALLSGATFSGALTAGSTFSALAGAAIAGTATLNGNNPPTAANQITRKDYVDSVASDMAAKENVKDINYNVIPQLMELDTFTFNYKEGVLHKRAQHKTRFGLSANQLQEVLPEAVHECDGINEGLLGADYAELVPVLIKAIQELQEQVDALQEH